MVYNDCGSLLADKYGKHKCSERERESFSPKKNLILTCDVLESASALRLTVYDCTCIATCIFLVLSPYVIEYRPLPLRLGPLRATNVNKSKYV